jgi:2-polyprenyl-6-methoxyphenol hydroxylase-like FAD-dependent oxidoreductase
VHRVHLHNALKEHATRVEGPGTPAILRLSTRIVHVDSASGIIELGAGEKVKGDLVIGADGVGSRCRRFVPGGDVKPYDSGKSAFRFLIEKQKVLAHSELKKYIDKDGFLVMWIGNDRRLIMVGVHTLRVLALTKSF